MSVALKRSTETFTDAFRFHEVERVLSTPELLLAIFSVADDDVLLAAATVCRKWSPLALDYLWRDLKSVVPLLELVSPLIQQNPGDNWQFLQSTADWERFDAYANRIRSIAFDNLSSRGGAKSRAVTVKVIAEFSLYHPRGAFFPPNLRRLSWGGQRCESAMAVLPFISRSTEHLHLRLGGDVLGETAEKLFRCITQRQTNLKSLSLDSTTPQEDLSNYLVQLISNSPQLESVALPRYYQTQIIVEALGRLPQLRRLAINHQLYQEDDPRGQALSFSPGRFLGLKDAEIDAPVPDITRLLLEFQPAAQLQHLTASCAKLDKTSDAFDLVATIAQRCPALQTLAFNFCSSNAPASEVNLAFGTFRPLLSCRNLHSFRIGFGKPLKPTELDFQDMALAWPNLRVLVLCPGPRGGQSEEGFSWDMLPTIASLFPYLERFSTYFSSTTEDKFSGDIFPQGEFRLLKKLDVGVSTVPKDRAALGFLIGAYCRLPVSISCKSFDWEQRWRTDEDVRKWQEVENIARRAVQVKQEIRKRWHLRENDGNY